MRERTHHFPAGHTAPIGAILIARRTEAYAGSHSGHAIVATHVRPCRRAPRRAVLPAGRFLHRSLASRRAGGHHARAWRPCAARARALPRIARDREPVMRAAVRRGSALTTVAYGETLRHEGVALSACTRPGTSSARRRCGSSTAARSGSPRATTSSSADADLRAVRARALRRASSPNRRSACRSIAGAPQARCSPTINALVARATRRAAARAWSTPTRSARRSACSRGVDPSIGPIVAHGAVESLNDASIAKRACALPPTQLRRRMARGRHCRGALVVAPPSAQRHAVAAALRRLRATPSPAAGCRCAARGGVAASIAASCCRDHADWPGCSARSRRRARARDRHARLRAAMVRWLGEQRPAGADASPPSTATSDDDRRRAAA